MKINREYKDLTKDILNNEKFLILKNDHHHGTTKYDHCRRVGHLSFWMSKLFKSNIEVTTRAGLLHDFFYGERTDKEENSYLKHPIVSSKNAKEYFGINKKEEKVIESHMYHYALVKKVSLFANEEDNKYLKEHKPSDKESIIVCISDLLVSIFEVCAFKIKYSIYLYSLFLINWIRI